MKVEMAVLGSPSLLASMISVHELEQRRSELLSCVKVEVALLGSRSLIVRMASVRARKVTLKLNRDTQSSGAV